MGLTFRLAVLLGMAFSIATLSHASITLQNTTTIPGAYVVEFVEGHDHASFYNSLSASGIEFSPRMNLSYGLFNGVSFSVTNVARGSKTASKISLMPAVKTIWPMHLYPVPEFQRLSTAPSLNNHNTVEVVSKPKNGTAVGHDAFAPHVMTQVDRLHAAGFTGEGVRIGIIDTGVDYYHPDLGGCFGEGCLISHGYDLVGKNFNGFNSPVPDPDPYDDCGGHGTHVAGIIGARPNRFNFTGAAPGASLGMYKVFSCNSLGTTDDALIAAFNMAFEDGSNIITASIGGSGGWSEKPWSLVVSRIVDNGVPCTLAAGNAGRDGMWYASSAADGKGVTAVSSFDSIVTPFLLSSGRYSTNLSSVSKSFGWLPGIPPLGDVSLPIWATSHESGVKDDACASLPADSPDLSKFIVLIRMATACTLAEQVKNVAAFNAKHVLFYASSPDDLLSFDRFYTGDINGTGVVLPEQGAEWVKILNRGSEVRLTFVDPSNASIVYAEVQNDVTGGFASSFTSWGPTWELDVYPTIGAPGGYILSTYLLNEGGYAVASGTSMATPFVAAVYALVGQARGTFDPAELAVFVCSNSQAQLWNDGTGALHGVAPVPQQGAGLVQAYDAAFARTQLSTKSISFNDTDHFIRNVTFTIRNLGSKSVTYRLGNRPALSMNTLSSGSLYPEGFPNAIIGATVDMEFSPSRVTIMPKESAEITVLPGFAALKKIRDSNLPVFSGYITINGTGNEDLAIPYLGVLGSMHEASLIDPPRSQMLGYPNPGTWPADPATYPGNITFTVPYPTLETMMTASLYVNAHRYVTYPSANMILNFGTRIVRVDVVPLWSNYTGQTKTVLGQMVAGSAHGFPLSYLPRSWPYVIFTGMLADGSVVPEGMYALAMRALKLFGDPEKVDDYEGLVQIPFTLYFEDGPTKPVGMRKRP